VAVGERASKRGDRRRKMAVHTVGLSQNSQRQSYVEGVAINRRILGLLENAFQPLITITLILYQNVWRSSRLQHAGGSRRHYVEPP